VRWWKPYEALLESKPVPGDEAVRDLIAKELVELYEAFPPPEDTVHWEDAALERKYKGKLAELPALDTALVDQLTKIVVLDLQHEIDQVDHIMRNNHHRAAAPTQKHVDALLLLWRVVLEHLEQRKDDAKGALKRGHLVEIAERAGQRFRARSFARN
jgi:hypothetical protein